MIKNINENYGDAIVFESVEEMAAAIKASGYTLPVDGLVSGQDYVEIAAGKTPVFESSCNTKPDYYTNPDTFENKGENAEPTSRCLSGTKDFWAAEEWAEPVTAPDGRKATKYYLFAAEGITDDEGNALEADCYPWDAEHVSRIVIND